MAHKLCRNSQKYIYKTSSCTINLNDESANNLDARYNTFIIEGLPEDGSITINLPSCATVQYEVYTFILHGIGLVTFNANTGDRIHRTVFGGSETNVTSRTIASSENRTFKLLATYHTDRSGDDKGLWYPV